MFPVKIVVKVKDAALSGTGPSKFPLKAEQNESFKENKHASWRLCHAQNSEGSLAAFIDLKIFD